MKFDHICDLSIVKTSYQILDTKASKSVKMTTIKCIVFTIMIDMKVFFRISMFTFIDIELWLRHILNYPRL